MKVSSTSGRMLKGVALLFIWAFGLADLAGCGGGGGSGSGGEPPVIISESGSQTATESATATFSVSAQNTQSYQWQVNNGGTWNAVPGATAATLSIPNVTLAMDGTQYRVQVTGSGQTVVSSVFVLTVTATVKAPAITTQPADQAVVVGQTATLSVVATGTSPTYEWQVSTNGGTTWVTIPSATTDTLSLPNVAKADDGKRYRVLVRNSAGSITSASALLSVTDAPVAPTIATQPANQAANPGQNVTFSVGAVGTSLAYQWQSSPDGTTWTPIAGATATSLTLTNVVLADNGKRYRVVVSNSVGSVTSSAALLTVADAVVAPSITTQPVSQSVLEGQNTSMSVVATGTTPTYQWEVSADAGVNWSPVANATSATLALQAVPLADNGKRYRVKVTNSAGSATSQVATLTVTPAPTPPAITGQPVGSTRIVGQNFVTSVTATGVGISYAWESSVNGNDPWVAIAGATSATLTIPAVAITDHDKRFRAKVSNAVGTVTSGSAALSVKWGSVETSGDLSRLEDIYAGGDGGTAGGGDGAGADGGGGLGKTLNALMTVTRLADGALVGQALTHGSTGLVKIKAGPGAGPFLMTLSGNANATYFDESKNALVPFGPGQVLHALVDKFDENVGVSAFTEAAYVYALNNYLADPAAIAAGTAPLRTTGSVTGLTLAQVQAANAAVLNEINRTLQSAVALTSVKSLPTPVGTDSGDNTLSTSRYGIAAAITGGFTLSAGGYLPVSAAPALEATNQIALDLSDGRLNGFALDGTPAAPGSSVSYDAAYFPAALNRAQYALSQRFGVNSTFNLGSGVVNNAFFSDSTTDCPSSSIVTLLKDRTLLKTTYNFGRDQSGNCVLLPNNPVQTPNFATNVAIVKGTSIVTYVVKDGGAVSLLRGDNGCGPSALSTLPKITSLTVANSTPSAAIRFGAAAIARDSTGFLYSWGADSDGSLGLGSGAIHDPPIPGSPFLCVSTPQKIPTISDIVILTSVTNISDSGEQRVTVSAVNAAGDLYQWGRVPGRSASVTSPTLIQGISGIVSIAVNQVCNVILRKDRTVWLFGSACIRTTNGTSERLGSVPVQVPNLPRVVEVASDGAESGYVLQDDGVVLRFRPWNPNIDPGPTVINGGMIVTPETVLRPLQVLPLCTDYNPGASGIAATCKVPLVDAPIPRIVHMESSSDNEFNPPRLGVNLYGDDGNIYKFAAGYIARVSQGGR